MYLQPIAQDGEIALKVEGSVVKVVFDSGAQSISILIRGPMYYRQGFDKFTQELRWFLGRWKDQCFELNFNDKTYTITIKSRLRCVWADIEIKTDDLIVQVGKIYFKKLLDIADGLDEHFK